MGPLLSLLATPEWVTFKPFIYETEVYCSTESGKGIHTCVVLLSSLNALAVIQMCCLEPGVSIEETVRVARFYFSYNLSSYLLVTAAQV